ncbi:MAG TPA: HNH endonuclease [Polyangiaceae bacterium]|nr:HNH endonuclease [Polyangiaceae bacterium]
MRRAVFERDAARCAYVDARGERCRETHRLEIHHLQPFAAGGEHSVSNLALRCAAHNALAAEQDFGRELVAQKRDSRRHESLSSQGQAAHDRRGGPASAT